MAKLEKSEIEERLAKLEKLTNHLMELSNDSEKGLEEFLWGDWNGGVEQNGGDRVPAVTTMGMQTTTMGMQTTVACKKQPMTHNRKPPSKPTVACKQPMMEDNRKPRAKTTSMPTTVARKQPVMEDMDTDDDSCSYSSIDRMEIIFKNQNHVPNQITVVKDATVRAPEIIRS